jgi:Tol biopolymer transport system component/DNA-binding winged helix-turn-helix (wHTH) protein
MTQETRKLLTEFCVVPYVRQFGDMGEIQPIMPECGAAEVIRFGAFEVDARAGELRRNGSRVKLQEQPLQVLLALLAKPGQVVTREELQARLWPADTFVDFDHGLNAAVKRLRDALGDSAENPRFIETLAKRGYRFLVPLNSHMAMPVPVSVPTASSAPKARRHARLLAGLALLLFGTALGFSLGHHVTYHVAARMRPKEQRLTANAPEMPVSCARLSPDGQYLAYSDLSGLFIRVVATGETHALNLPANFVARTITWLPDGGHLLLSRRRPAGEPDSVWSMSVLDGKPKWLMENGEPEAVSWGGSKIVFARGEVFPQELWVMSADGSQARRITTANQQTIFGAVAWSPDDRKLAFIRFVYEPGYFDGKGVMGILDLANGTSKDLLEDAGLENALAWTRDNRLIYSLREPQPNRSDSNLWAVAVDPQTSTLRGAPQKITDGPDRKIEVSATKDGKALAYLRVSERSHIYISPLGKAGENPATTTRLSLDEGNNLPYAWTPNGESIIFTSDRDGVRHLYKQGLHEATPELLMGGDSAVMIARLSPDRSEILYTEAPANRTAEAEIRIMAIPLGGGSPRQVLQAQGIEDIQCPRGKSESCVMIKLRDSRAVYSMFDPKTGAQKTLSSSPLVKRNHSISPDGKSMLVAEYRQRGIPAKVFLYSLRDNSSKTIRVEGWGEIEYLDWDADGKTFWISAANAKNVRGLLRVDLQGHATPFLTETDKYLGWGISSPDSKHIAYWKGDSSANAWLLRNY